MANMGRNLSLYALLVIAIVMSTATTTATTTTEDPSTVYTEVVTITDTEATLTPSPLTTSTGTDDGTSTTDEVTVTVVMTTSNMDTATSNTNPPSSPSSSFSLSTASGTLTTSDSAGSTDEETNTSPSITTEESTTSMNTYSMTTAASNTNPSSSPTSSLSLSTGTEIVSEMGSTVGTSSSSIISTEAATMTPSGSYTAGKTTEALSSSSSIASTTARAEPTTELSTIATTNSSTEGLTELLTEPPSEPRTDPRTEPTTEPKVGPVPEPTFPQLDGTAEKTYQFEFAVDESTTAKCTSTNLLSVACDIFKHNITQELEAVYGQSKAFVRVEVVLRAGSVIVNHNVTYSYNDMTPDQRMASAQDIYDETLGKEVADGNFGNYTVIYCETCATPKETSTICDFPERDIDCQSEYSKPTCKDNYWVCESICDTTYCNGNGICWQRDDLDTKPICSCDWDDDHWYWGYSCQFYVNETFLIIGCSCSGAVLIVLLASLIAYVCVKSSDKSDNWKFNDSDITTGATSSSENGDDVIHAFRNLAYDHGTETVFRPVDDIDYLDDGEIVQQKRPFSYTDTKGENYTTIDSSGIIRNQNGGGQRDSRMAVNEDAAKRQSNGSATDYRHSSFMKSNGTSQQRDPDFWGNLNEHVVEQIKLEPVLDHIDVNESFRIQRPRISPNYSFSNTIASPNSNAYQNMDSAQNQYIPEADYAQR